jgi:hypothetical protein
MRRRGKKTLRMLCEWILGKNHAQKKKGDSAHMHNERKLEKKHVQQKKEDSAHAQ